MTRLIVLLAVECLISHTASAQNAKKPSPEVRKQIQAKIDEGTKYLDAYLAVPDKNSTQATDALKNLASARTEAIKMVRDAYVDDKGKSILDPSIKQVQVPGEGFKVKDVPWNPGYRLGDQNVQAPKSNDDLMKTTGLAQTDKDGSVKINEAAFTGSIDDLASVILHEGIHFGTIPLKSKTTASKRKFKQKNGETMSVEDAMADEADDEDIKAFKAELQFAKDFGVDPIESEFTELKLKVTELRKAERAQKYGDDKKQEIEKLKAELKALSEKIASQINEKLKSGNPDARALARLKTFKAYVDWVIANPNGEPPKPEPSPASGNGATPGTGTSTPKSPTSARVVGPEACGSTPDEFWSKSWPDRNDDDRNFMWACYVYAHSPHGSTP